MTEDDLAMAETYKEEGNKLFAEGKFNDALEKYEQAIQCAPTAAIYYSNASACCARLEEHGKAALFAEEALRLDPTLVKAYYRRAVALIGLQQWKSALDDLRKIVKLNGGVQNEDVQARRKICEKELQKIAFAKAIHVDEFCLDMQHISDLEVVPSFEGPLLNDNDSIDLKFVSELRQWFYEEKKLPIKYVYRILYEAKVILEREPNVVHLSVPRNIEGDGKLTICGDIHGQFFDLLHIFDSNGFPSESHPYLFNGDIVDRGPASVEVALFMLALKAAMPASFYIARGNHESESVNRMHGFYEELCRKYPSDPKAFTLFNQVLHCLPLVHVVENSYFVVHGGLPLGAESTLLVSDIDNIDRKCIPEPASLMSQLLWSDPQDSPGIAPSHRGEGILFGPDVTDAFLVRNKLCKIIRSHVWEVEGYREQHDGKCITIFSAPNYTGSISKGAVINVTIKRDDGTLEMSYFQYDACPHQGTSTLRPRLSPMVNNFF